MRAIRSVVLGAVLMATAGAAPAMAQSGARFSLGGGLTLPLGDFGDAASTGFHGLAAVAFQPADFPVGIQVDGMFQRLGTDEDPVLGDVDANFQILQGTANAVYRFQTSEESKVHPYLIGGVGLYNYKLTGTISLTAPAPRRISASMRAPASSSRRARWGSSSRAGSTTCSRMEAT